MSVGPPPPFDPECAAVLEAFGDLLSPAIRPEDIGKVRARSAVAAPTDDDLARGGAYAVSTHGPLLVCTPRQATDTVIAYIHGGGMIMGDNRSGLDAAMDLAEPLGLAVASVEYRLAPEHPHPAPVDDCYAGLLAAASLGYPNVVIAGTSAGGGLAAAVTLMARDRGGPALAGQLLMCPMLDDRNDSVSARQMAGVGIWDRTANATGWGALLGDAAGGPDVSHYAAPARATDLSGLPPTFIDVGSAETFRDEDVEYASRIWAAGGVCELHVWPGGFHAYPGFAPASELARQTVAARLQWLRRLLAA